MSESELDREIEEIASTAEWRRRKAVEFPDDARNSEAASRLDSIAASLEALRGTAKAATFSTLVAALSSGAADQYYLTEEWNSYRRAVGFSVFPEDGEAYLDSLLSILERSK